MGDSGGQTDSSPSCGGSLKGSMSSVGSWKDGRTHGGPMGGVLGVYQMDADAAIALWEGPTYSAGNEVGCH